MESGSVWQILGPKPDEMRQSDRGDEEAIHQSVEQEKQEELVRRKRHAVIYPRTLGGEKFLKSYIVPRTLEDGRNIVNVRATSKPLT